MKFQAQNGNWDELLRERESARNSQLFRPHYQRGFAFDSDTDLLGAPPCLEFLGVGTSVTSQPLQVHTVIAVIHHWDPMDH